MDKLTLTTLVSSPAILLITASLAHGQGIHFEHQARSGSLVEQGCAWGRGAQAIKDAKSDATTSLTRFLTAPSNDQLSSGDFDRLLATFDSEKRQSLINALELGEVTPVFSDAFLLGSDTCVKASLHSDAGTQIDSNSVVWGEEEAHSALVMGDSRNAANVSGNEEQKALIDAITKGLSSAFNWLVSAEQINVLTANDHHTVVAVRQNNVATRIVLLENWQQLDKSLQSDGSVKATFNLSFREPNEKQKNSIIRAYLEQPAFYIDADDKKVADKLSQILSLRGERVVTDSKQSALTLNVQTDYPESVTGQQLSLSVNINDPSGQQFGHWKNEPSLIALNKSNSSKQQLINTHFANANSLNEIDKQLNNVLLKLFELGGPQHKVFFQPSKVGNEAQLVSLIGVIDEARDVRIHQENNYVVLTLRYPHTAAKLAQYLVPALSIHQPNRNAQVEIVHDYHIVVE
ncbi:MULTISPECIES: hypothetical protein [unclassified Vibrio]|uniref:hypothetical protein n=1 Tax=unclassified Vibrio TaxID=2614977 RepID=UPI00355246EC